MQTILFAKPASPALEGANGAKKVELAEFRPVHVGKIQLASGALPKEKTRKADFTARADDEIEIGQAGGVKSIRLSLRGLIRRGSRRGRAHLDIGFE